VTDAYVELWGCNSTGVYTGVQAKGNGDGTATAIKTNALRGLQPTAKNGTATFITVIPGHYVGRANHLHSKLTRSCQASILIANHP
jgi:protocatechuate 3,4-dioxygenase beta subunit